MLDHDEIFKNLIEESSNQNKNIEPLKVAIIGRGTSSIMQICALLNSGINNITVFYDPKIPELPVGESTVPLVQNTLLNALGLTLGELHERGIASFKSGVKFIDWGVGKEFTHYFYQNQPAFHFFTKDFNKFIEDRLIEIGIKFVGKNVSDVKETESSIIIDNEVFDFLIHCSGWNNQNFDFSEPLLDTVNSAILFTNDKTSIHETVHRAHKHGWQFELPFPEKNISKCGRLFNKNLTSEEEIKQDLNLPADTEYKVVSWNPRFNKKLIISKRQAVNGNALFFLEPLQAFSTFYYIKFAKYVSTYIKEMSNESMFTNNIRYLDDIKNYQYIVLLHYSYG